MKKISILLPLLLGLPLAGCSSNTLTPSIVKLTEKGELSAASHHMKWWEGKQWSDKDVEWLARSMAAEARGEVERSHQTGNRVWRDSVIGCAYWLARTSVVKKKSIERTIKDYPYLLSSWLLANKYGNGCNYEYFFKPTNQIENWDELCTIARQGMSGSDPSGIDPNNYYDDKLEHNPPNWAHGAGVERKKIGHFIFVFNPLDP